MIELLNPQKDEFLSRFYHFYDALVRSVQISFNAIEGTKLVTLILSSQDQHANQENGWSNVTVVVEEAEEFILIEGKSTCVVLSSGLNIEFFDGRIYLDFCPYTEAPDGIEDFRKSHFLIAGKRCTWSVSPYREDVG